MHREVVAQEFDKLLGGPGDGSCKGQGLQRRQTPSRRPAHTDMDDLLAQMPEGLRARVTAWRDHPRVLALREESRARPAAPAGRALPSGLSEGRASEEAAIRLTDWIEALLRRESYLALLLERPPCTSGCCACWARPAAGALPATAPRRH